jgi:class 3 adenylate cyclase/CheY-like chemotaxis protein
MPEERRLVTVLFADVVGSTSLGGELDPEDLRALLARYYALAREIVAAHGGTLEKFIGDAVMAIFGLPTAHDDDPRRALDAAIKLRDAVRADPALGERLPIRIGVNTGEVVASIDRAAADFLVTGDAVNIAARLQQSADRWAIVAGERTVRAAGDAFSYIAGGSVEARGRAEPVEARTVLGRSTARSVPRTPIIGREADLAQLELVARRAFTERRPYLVTIMAPPGTGKSRLLEAFLEGLPGSQPDATVAVAQCLPYGQRLTYWPLRALLQAITGIDDDPSGEGLRHAIVGWLRDNGDPEADGTADQLAATLGATELEVVDRHAVFAAWRRAIELAAMQRPLVLVVEDLHWSSESLLDLVEFIFQPRADLPLLMLALSRPELLDRRPGWGGGRRNYLSLALEPLGDDEVRQLVASLLEDPGEAVVSAVVDRADGNPFYAGELVRSLMEHGPDLSDAEGVAQALARLPDTVQATVLARLDLLPAHARRLLQVLAVIGRSFEIDAARAMEPSLSNIDDAVSLVTDRELLVPISDGTYAFRHILIREVAYQTLPRTERAALHAAAGGHLEANVGDAEGQAELVAFHFREAAALAATLGDDRPDIRASAVTWLRRAADAAFGGGATGEAVRHLRAAIDLAERADFPELNRRLGEVSFGGNASVEAFATAYRIGTQLGRPPHFLLLMLAEQLMVLTRWHASVAAQPEEDELDAIRDAARKLMTTVDDDRARATFLIAEGFVPFWIRSNGKRPPTEQEMTETRASADAGLALAEQIGDARLLSAALDAVASLVAEDDPTAAGEIQRRRWGLADRLSLLERTDAYQTVAWQSALLGDVAAALEAADTGLGTVQPGQSPDTIQTLYAWRGWALAMSGRWDEVRPALAQTRQAWIDSGRLSAAYVLHGPLTAALVGAARRDEGLVSDSRELVDEITRHFPTDHPAYDLSALARFDLNAIAARIVGAWERYIERLHHVGLAIAVATDRGHPLPADALDRLVAHTEPRRMRWIEAEARRARALGASNIDELRRAVTLFEGTGARPRLARARAELGQLSGDEELASRGLHDLETLGDAEGLSRLAAPSADRER